MNTSQEDTYREKNLGRRRVCRRCKNVYRASLRLPLYLGSKLCLGAPLFGFSGALAATFGGRAVVSPTPFSVITAWLVFAHHIPSSSASATALHFPRHYATRLACLTSRPCITIPHLDAISSLGITPRSFSRRLAYRFSGSFLCISGLHSISRRVGISVRSLRSLRAESGELCGTEYCYQFQR